jgi:hypothetical protein
MKYLLPFVSLLSLVAACDRESPTGATNKAAAPFVPAMPPSALTRMGKKGCFVGMHRCTGEKLEACDDERGFVPVNTCMSAAHCNAALQQCLVDPCILGEKQCNGRWLEQCNANGWRQIEDCKQAAACNATLGKCE